MKESPKKFAIPDSALSAGIALLALFAVLVLLSRLVMEALLLRAGVTADEYARSLVVFRTVILFQAVFAVVIAAGYGLFVARPRFLRLRHRGDLLASEVAVSRAAEAVLRDRDAFLQSVLRSAPDLIYVYDAVQKSFPFTSQPLADFYGFAPAAFDALIGDDPLGFIHPDDRERVGQEIQLILDGARAIEFTARVLGGDGAERMVRVRGVPFGRTDGAIRQILGFVTDITDLQRTTDALAEKNRLIEQVSSSVPEMIYAYDFATQRNTYVNHDVGALLGYDGEQRAAMGDARYTILMHPDDFALLPEHFERVKRARDEEIVEFEYRMRAADGTWTTWVSRDKVFRRDADGAVMQLIGVASDVTASRQAEARAFELKLEQERMRLNAEFIANSSHELRTPLTIINSSAYVLMRSADPQMRQTQFAKIEAQVEKLTALIDELQTMATLDAEPLHKRVPLELNPLVVIACGEEATALGRPNDVELSLARRLPSVAGDPHSIARAVKHLIQNALRYQPEGQAVRVSTSHEDSDVSISITDNGPGIAKEELPLIFQHFYKVDKSRQTPHGGAGLGLTMVKKIAESHGGRVEVTSRPGETCFRLLLPAQLEPVPRENQQEVP